jgi:LysR family hydrogen peroxide-inducible transcriptional activator
MNLPSSQQLRYLVALADQGHFGRAAATCAVTQSTLSAGILALERQLDAPLIERGATRRPVFTAIGMEVVARARLALAALEEVSEAAAAARDPLSGPLRLGVIPTIGPFLLPRLMPALRAAFPRLKLFLREEMTERLMLQLDQGKLDLLLLALPCDCAAAEQVAIAADPFVLALPAQHRLAAQPVVALEALAAERVLLLEDGHCLRAQAQEACGLPRGLAAGDGFAATSLHTLVQMAAGGLGLALLPRLAVEGGVLAGTDWWCAHWRPARARPRRRPPAPSPWRGAPARPAPPPSAPWRPPSRRA